MKTKHTPGPWLVATGDVGVERTGSAYGSYGCLITEANGKFGNIIIADVIPVTPDIDSSLPNARLIAAAPDLLEALEEALPGIEELNGEFQEGWDSTIEKIESAIKKAKGL